MKKKVAMITLILLVATLSCVGKNIRKNIPICRTKAEIVAHDGQVVTLEGVFKAYDAGKTWVTCLVIHDGTRVIYRYSRLKNLEGRKAKVTGTIYKRGYPSKYIRQMLLAPHIRNISSVKMLESHDQ